MSASTGVTRFEVHHGVYKDSLVLMQLQSRLLGEAGVIEAGATMASAANLALLAAGGLLPKEAASGLVAEDLLVVVRAESADQAESALAKVTDLLASRESGGAGSFRPRSLDGAISQLPGAKWALVSVPGQHAPRVTEDALDRDLNVFLYSDNVPGTEEARLKRLAAARGLMVLGPDCGTAIIGGIGFGFANHVRRGSIGLVGGSGTGLQAVSVAVDTLGGGISQAIGTGGHDLSTDVGGLATRQALQVLADDPDTEVIALISKSPGRQIAEQALGWAATCSKPVVVYFQAFEAGDRTNGDPEPVHLARSLTEVAEISVRLAGPVEQSARGRSERAETKEPFPEARTDGFVRGLFAGGTLAAEALLQLHGRLAPLYSNLPGDWRRLDDVHGSREHTVVDLGADELTRGRLHPMVDQQPRLERLRREAAEPDVA